MFSPECRTEYRDGYTVCADCNVHLVEAIEPESDPEFIDYKEVLAAYNPADIVFLKSLLESERIQYF
jgi:hypothetical protein